MNHFTWANERAPGILRDGELEVMLFPVDARDGERYLALQQRIGRGEPLTDAEEAAWLMNGVRSRALIAHLRAADYERVIAGPYLFGLTVDIAEALPERLLLVPCLHDEPFARLRTIRAMFARARGCLFNSDPELELAQRLVGFDPARGRVVGMGIEPFEADPTAFAASRALDAPYVIYSGRREAAKGTPALIEYLRTFRERTGRDVRLVLTGSGPVEPAPFVLDAGVLPEREKREALAGARVFVHSSRLESFGIVLLEAFMARVPALVPTCCVGTARAPTPASGIATTPTLKPHSSAWWATSRCGARSANRAGDTSSASTIGTPSPHASYRRWRNCERALAAPVRGRLQPRRRDQP